MRCFLAICVASLLSFCIQHAAGHGYLLNPPARGTAWRVGFKTPRDYDDNGYNCGGKSVQHSKQNSGKCGVCGNGYSSPIKSNEPGPGNKYATGTIVANYHSGETIDVTVMTTAYHKGYYEFRLCDNDVPQKGKDASIAVTQQCFNQHLLTAEDGVSTHFNASPLKSTHRVKLPVGVQCTACVFQWRYRAGNNWGCEGKKCGNGYGKQEEFWGCADIAIGQSSRSRVTRAYSTTVKPVRLATATSTVNSRPVVTSAGDKRCHGKAPYGSSLDSWCNMNCNAKQPYCPPSHCQC